MPMIMNTADEMIFINDNPIHAFTIEVPFGFKDQPIRFTEVVNLQAVHHTVPRSYLENILAEAKNTFNSPIVLYHTFKTPSGRNFPLTYKDFENLKIIMTASTPNELLKEIMKRKGKVIL